MILERRIEPEGITLAFRPRGGPLRKPPRTIAEAAQADQSLLLALADLRAAAEAAGEAPEIGEDRIRLSHRLAASLPMQAAQRLGLPLPFPFTLATETEGVLGSPTFRLRLRILDRGREVPTARTGAILTAAGRDWLLPAPLLEAFGIAEALAPGDPLERQWERLARFRLALDPEALIGAGTDFAGRVEMSGFLAKLRIRVAERFAISPHPSGEDFDPVPFAAATEGPEGPEQLSESEAVLADEELAAFQKRVRGPLGDAPAYRVGDGSYLVVDPGARPALRVMAAMQRAAPEERAAFVRNPGPALAAAYEEELRRAGRLDGLDGPEADELIETETGGRYVETREYSERVIGTGRWSPPPLPPGALSEIEWLPEDVALPAAPPPLPDIPPERVPEMLEAVRVARAEGRETAAIPGIPPVPATAATEAALRAVLPRPAPGPGGGTAPDRQGGPPEVLLTRTNIWEAEFVAGLRPRGPADGGRSSRLRTTCLPHQVEALRWQAEAWGAGLPGILNADEQGLGKTFETLGFLAWLQDRMEAGGAERLPLLVVAPTTLLRTWEEEVTRHLGPEGLGTLLRLYGADLARARRGRDPDSLDLPALDNALRDGRAHRFWLLVSYQTLADHHRSLACRRFAAVVLDEIQALKNPATLRANAARALNAEFRIGLTGTPVENTMGELWAVMDQLAPGGLGTLRDFVARHAAPAPEMLETLRAGLFAPQAGRPAAAIRRLKSAVARDLLPKERRLHPALMPPAQAAAYDRAHLHLRAADRGAMLKALHHIRGVSAHPDPGSAAGDRDFIAMSARLAAAFRVLDRVREAKERALVFIESLRLQARFVALAEARYRLPRIDVINGNTPIARRQAAVERFQRHLGRDEGFDLLVLGPRAAGVGLTLTAATHVLHLSRWWNPAVEEQCNDRVHRIGQRGQVTVHLPMAIHPEFRDRSFDCQLERLMAGKRELAARLLAPMGDRPEDADALLGGLARPLADATSDPLSAALAGLFAAIGRPVPPREADGSLRL